MHTGPSELDVIFGKAVLAFRMITKQQLDVCLSIQRQLQSAGTPKTLAQVVVKQGLLNQEQYKQIVEEIRRRFGPQLGLPRNLSRGSEPVSVVPPVISTSGRYMPTKLSSSPSALYNAPSAVPNRPSSSVTGPRGSGRVSPVSPG